MRILLTLVALLCVAQPSVAFAADPYAGYIYPCGIQAGATNRFLIGGQNMGKIRGVHFSEKGLNVLNVEQVPGFPNPTVMQMKHLRKWLDGIANGNRDEPEKPDDPHIDEWRSNSWWRVLGTLDAFEISIVERNLFTPRNALQDAPSLRQLLIVTIAADADAKPGIREFSVWNDKGMSAPRPFMVASAARAAEPLYVPAHRGKSEIPIVDATHDGVFLDGQIMPGETDVFKLRLAGGRRYCVRVTARELQPYVGDAVPGFFNPVVAIRDGNGRVVAKGDDAARFRPDPEFDFKPYVPDVYTVEIHDVLYRGRPDFVYSIEVAPYSADDAILSMRKREFSFSQDHEETVRFGGTLSKAGARDVREFSIDAPGRRVFEVIARRNGSSIDAVLSVVKKPEGKLLAQWDDTTNRVFVGTVPQGECDPVGEFDFKEAGCYAVEIFDRTGHGGADYFWELEMRPPSPAFEVYSARSTLPLNGLKPLKVDFVIVRKDGFMGDVTLEFPKDVKAKGNVATSGVERITVELAYTARKPLGPNSVDVYAAGKVNGKMVRRNVVPCDEYEQAFAWKHFVPAKSFVVRAVPGKQSAKPRKNRNKPNRVSQERKLRDGAE